MYGASICWSWCGIDTESRNVLPVHVHKWMYHLPVPTGILKITKIQNSVLILCLHENFFVSGFFHQQHWLQHLTYNDSFDCYHSSFHFCYLDKNEFELHCYHSSFQLCYIDGTEFELLSMLDNHRGNNDSFSIDCTNTDVANGSVIAANNKQLEAQNDTEEENTPNRVWITEGLSNSNANGNARVIATIVKHIEAWNNKEEETVYRVTDSYDSYNINSNIIICNGDSANTKYFCLIWNSTTVMTFTSIYHSSKSSTARMTLAVTNFLEDSKSGTVWMTSTAMYILWRYGWLHCCMTNNQWGWL